MILRLPTLLAPVAVVNVMREDHRPRLFSNDRINEFLPLDHQYELQPSDSSGDRGGGITFTITATGAVIAVHDFQDMLDQGRRDVGTLLLLLMMMMVKVVHVHVHLLCRGLRVGSTGWINERKSLYALLGYGSVLYSAVLYCTVVRKWYDMVDTVDEMVSNRTVSHVNGIVMFHC
jgi:hypothetical protein